MRVLNRSAAQSTTEEITPSREALAQVRRWTKAHFLTASGSHDWEHTLRVQRLCQKIGPMEGADMAVLEAAAYLHDIGRSTQDKSNGAVCHAATGAEMATRMLEGISFDETRKQNIIHCIRSHRFRDDYPPETVEARVLFDADKLDAIGAVGVARAYLFAGELGACLHNPDLPVDQAQPYSRDDTGHREYVVKLSKIRKRMLTRTGRQLAEDRHAFMTMFFERFLNEYDGRC